MRSLALTSTTLASSSSATGPRTSRLASWVRSVGSRPSRSATWSSYGERLISDQDHDPWAIHDGPADAGRALQGRTGNGARLRSGRERRGPGAVRRRRRRRSARRALPRGQARAGAGVRRRGHQQGARRNQGDDRPPYLLRLRPLLRQGEAGRLLVPRGIERVFCTAAIDRGGAAETRCLDSRPGL